MTQPSPFEITGQRAIVTGAAHGIGFGIAQRLLQAGARVLLVDLDEAGLRVAERRLGGTNLRTLVADIAQDGAGARSVAACVQGFGGVDLLVNDAGIFPQVPMLTMTPELFDRVYRINLKGLAFFSQAAAKQMIAQGNGGKIINIGSVDSLHPSMVGLAAYDASKGGVLMFTRNFALEMAPHRVLVNCILPGGVETEGTQRPLEGSGLSAEQAQAVRDGFVQHKIPLRRMGVPDDIAKVALFLASSASDYMTGASIVVDGGMLLT